MLGPEPTEEPQSQSLKQSSTLDLYEVLPSDDDMSDQDFENIEEAEAETDREDHEVIAEENEVIAAAEIEDITKEMLHVNSQPKPDTTGRFSVQEYREEESEEDYEESEEETEEEMGMDEVDEVSDVDDEELQAIVKNVADVVGRKAHLLLTRDGKVLRSRKEVAPEERFHDLEARMTSLLAQAAE